MTDYNFWADLLQTWRSTSDWIKAVIVISAFACPYMMLCLILAHRREMWEAEVHSQILAMRSRGKAFLDERPDDWPEGLAELERVLMPDSSEIASIVSNEGRRFTRPVFSSSLRRHPRA